MKKLISYSAPAKVILSGEHAVVYGKPALVSAVDLRLKFTLTNSIRSSKDGNSSKAVLFISQKVKEFLKQKKIKHIDKQFHYEIESEIPIGRGLGSSAALCVAATAAFLDFYTGKEFPKEKVNDVAFQAEKYFHKNASGVDVSASNFGGFIFYRKEFEFLKNISSLNFRIPKKMGAGLYLIDSGKPAESTGEMVESVGRTYDKKPKLIEAVLNDTERTTKRMVVSIIKEDQNLFQKAILDNQILLDVLGVVSKKAREILKRLEPFGIGKVTGGGGKREGSGFILFLTNKKEELARYLKRQKIAFYKFQQDFRGLQRSNSDLAGRN